MLANHWRQTWDMSNPSSKAGEMLCSFKMIFSPKLFASHILSGSQECLRWGKVTWSRRELSFRWSWLFSALSSSWNWRTKCWFWTPLHIIQDVFQASAYNILSECCKFEPAPVWMPLQLCRAQREDRWSPGLSEKVIGFWYSPCEWGWPFHID